MLSVLGWLFLSNVKTSLLLIFPLCPVLDKAKGLWRNETCLGWQGLLGRFPISTGLKDIDCAIPANRQPALSWSLTCVCSESCKLAVFSGSLIFINGRIRLFYETLCALILCTVYHQDCVTVFQDYATNDNAGWMAVVHVYFTICYKLTWPMCLHYEPRKLWPHVLSPFSVHDVCSARTQRHNKTQFRYGLHWGIPLPQRLLFLLYKRTTSSHT